MNVQREKAAIILMLIIVLLGCLTNVKPILSDNNTGGKIDIFTQKLPFNGAGANQSSDAFQPQELVILYARVTYNEWLVGNQLVAFQVNGPANVFYNITVVSSNFTDENGLTQFSFRIPWPYENAEQIVFGEWIAVATTNIAGKLVMDTLTFKVGWILSISDVVTLNADFIPQTQYIKGEDIVFNLTIENIALTNKSATIIINAQDALNHPIMHIEFSKDFQPGKTNLYTSSQVPAETVTGNATISVCAYTSPPDIGGVPYSPAFLSEIEITGAIERYYLFVKVDPPYVTSIFGEGWYNKGANVLLNAPEYVPGPSGVRYKFSRWDVDGTVEYGNSVTVVMNTNHTVTAYYIIQYYLTAKTDPAEVATIEGEGWYDQYVNVTLTAPTVEGYEFKYWDVDGVPINEGVDVVTVYMDEPHTATAHYKCTLPIWGWLLPWWFYWLLLPILALIIALLIFWLYRRKKRKKAQEAFQKGWTAWYYGYDLRGKEHKSFK